MANGNGNKIDLKLETVPALDGLRAISVILVMLRHFNWIRLGWAGVNFFFVLSGFLIATNLLKSLQTGNGKQALLQFFERRARRIFPLYFLFLALYFLFERLGLFKRIFPISHISEKDSVLAHIFFLQNYASQIWHGNGHIQVLSHLWSIAVEMQFYLLIPFLFLCFRKKIVFAFMVGLLFFCPILRGIVDESNYFRNTATQLDAFSVGIILSLLWEKIAFRDWAFRYKAAISKASFLYICSLLGLGFWLLLANHASGNLIPITTFGFSLGSPGYNRIWVFTAINFLGGLFLIYCLTHKENLFLAHPVLRYLGRISFGIYIFHYPIALAFRQNVHLNSNVLLSIAMFWVFFWMSVVAASLSYFFWEKRFL